MSNIKKISTWLPVFPGFYETIFDERELFDRFVDYELGLNDDDLRHYYSKVFEAGVSMEFFRESFHRYLKDDCTREAVCEYLCDGLLRLDNTGIIKNIEFESISSPMYYNFSNDSINCSIEFDQEKLQKYIDDNMEMFTQFIEERYTSRSGFISSYSNDVDEWKDMSDLGMHSCGAVLDFVYRNEFKEDAEFELYWKANPDEPYMANVEFDHESMIEDFKNKGA